MSELSADQRGIIEEVIQPIESSTPAQFAREITALYHPQTHEEVQIAKERRERMRENERRLRRELPPSTGEVDHLRMTW